MPPTSSDELRRRANAASHEAKWREAASLYSRAISEARTEVKSRGRAGAEALALALGGRSKALAELGRPRNNLGGISEVLEACVADARSALAVHRRLNEVGIANNPSEARSGVEDALSWLAEALFTAGHYDEATQILREVISQDAQDGGGGGPSSDRFAEQLRRIELAQAAEAEAPEVTSSSAATLSASKQKEHSSAFSAEASDRASLATRLQPEIDESVDGRSPGTFRWAKTKELVSLPQSRESVCTDALGGQGWGAFLMARGGEALVHTGKTDPSLIDGLSFPLSLAWALKRAEVLPFRFGEGKQQVEERVLNVVILGATSKAEVRLWETTSYWQEFCVMLPATSGRNITAAPRVEFHFVGPEIDASSDDAVWPMDPPCAKTFFARRPELNSADRTVCVIYNGGFGNFFDSKRDELLWSWLPDLLFLADSGMLCAFFCANDYADVQGEALVHTELVGSRFVVPPCRNPFSMATVFTGSCHAERIDGQGDDWFCGNSYFYVTQGCDMEKRVPIDGDDPRRRQHLARLVQNCQTKGCMDFEHSTVRATGPTLRSPTLRGEARRDQRCEDSAGTASPKSAPTPLPCTSSGTCQMLLDSPEASVNFVEEAGQKTLRLIVELPKLRSLAEADLQISDDCVVLKSDTSGYSLRQEFPARIHSSLATAKFSSKRGRLVIQAPCL
eukprot:TRINITY_DN61267_c0_g1_i1.p1 TRINITY_DN61267_c0_g1~~TRINITY_DN61267_c0_g1_i1.p1  ORF type:complete len:679 (+),score=110.30 TRINITY_DN61267_c0_g1_i1:33-2069(+)